MRCNTDYIEICLSWRGSYPSPLLLPGHRQQTDAHLHAVTSLFQFFQPEMALMTTLNLEIQGWFKLKAYLRVVQVPKM